MEIRGHRDAAALTRTKQPVDWLHYTMVILVFSITGSLSILVSRFLLTGVLHLEGGVWSGPWSFRIAYVLLVPPFYSVTLVVVGTLFGKHAYFKRRVLIMWGRLLPRRVRSRSTEVMRKMHPRRRHSGVNSG